MSNLSDEHELTRFADSYIALWNEADPQSRRELLRELWTDDGVQVLVNPPQGMREALATLAVPLPSVEIRGRAAMEGRVRAAYEMFVAPGENAFAVGGPAVRLTGNLIGLSWLMVATKDGAVAGGGYDVLLVDGDGRIRWDHQYVGVS
ncbi:hypothetical protein [Nocardia jinanensis]|uniref:SnoaL-like domain-containing protein n=1 Tax=Nocardia jinanensis TaxID=382504 RepID=A0A917RQV5_9NOCA|nr:hypothetical protein [Nocardia jinanensis]GGL20361.1 hypothetical protein GCM10011588_38990 [Nocardia jinanensis]